MISSGELAENLETEDFWKILYGDGSKAKHDYYEGLAIDLFVREEDEDLCIDPEEDIEFKQQMLNGCSGHLLNCLDGADSFDRKYRKEKDPERSRFYQDAAKRFKGYAKKYSKQVDRYMSELEDPPADPIEDEEF